MTHFYNTSAIGFAFLAMATLLHIPARSLSQTICSAGPRDGQSCSTASDCPAGACVAAQGVCDGGTDDGLDCDCPLSSCSATPACTNDPVLGTCLAGPRAGECCDTAFNCADGSPCAMTQKICVDGPLKGFPCLRNDHCEGAACWAVGRRCDDGYPCVDDADCLAGRCQGVGNFPTPTPTAGGTVTPSPTPCNGDCDGDGAVTVDNILLMVNIALELADISACMAGDADGDGAIAVNEIVAAVNAALSGCP